MFFIFAVRTIAILFIVLSIHAFATMANKYQPIKGWNESLGISELDLINEVEGDTSFYYFVGDDGIECEGQTENYAIDTQIYNENKELVSFVVTYQAFQYVAPLCIPDLMNCQAEFFKVVPLDRTKAEHWMLSDFPTCKFSGEVE